MPLPRAIPPSPDPHDPLAEILSANPREIPLLERNLSKPPRVDLIDPLQNWLRVQSRVLTATGGESDLILPAGVKNLDDSNQIVEVLRVGPGRYSMQAGAHEPMDFEPGDRVYITGRMAIQQDDWEPYGYLLIPASECTCKIRLDPDADEDDELLDEKARAEVAHAAARGDAHEEDESAEQLPKDPDALSFRVTSSEPQGAESL
jgi:hypothetical protein